MDQCKSCGKKFSYSEIYKAFLTNKTHPFNCTECHQLHELKPGCWLIGYFIYFAIPAFFFFIIRDFSLKNILSFILLCCFLTLSVPFIYKFKKKLF